ncbi:DUF3726 domain-containing protein [Gymnodinialimonas sp. 57CJ19]|uniref:DUF3726 domain-containing protein n=1 Tax=Gymnodinialimonas sp. 57CJ19 TaxID=3138498 RepID=UPI00313431FB
MSHHPHDQTRGDSTPYFSEMQSAPLSCNEAASLCMKAARGAGMSWGLAEEAGFSAAWLVSHGLDGPSFLRAHLERADGKDWSDLCPAIVPGKWENAKGQAVCPIILGATLSDYAELPEGPVVGAKIMLGLVSAPILLLPFLSELGRAYGLTFTLSAQTGAVDINADPTSLHAAAHLLDVAQLELTMGVKADEPCDREDPSTPNAKTTAATIAALNTFAMRTTVPATDASRAGAGSTLSDND